MTRGKNIGGFTEETKVEFKVRTTRGKLKNAENTLKRMIELFDKYNEQYEAELKEQKKSAP
jgi:hypothetical protein